MKINSVYRKCAEFRLCPYCPRQSLKGQLRYRSRAQFKDVIFLWWAHLFGKFGSCRGVPLFGWLCSQSRGAGSPQVEGGPPKPSFSGSISTNNQNGPDLQAVITIIMTMTRSQKLAFMKLFWVLSNIQFSKTESDPLCKDGSVNGRIYERSNFGRCSLLINGSPQWENKCWGGKWLGPDRLMAG